MRKRVDPDKIIETVCRGSNTIAAIRSIGRNLERAGIVAAVKRHQTSVLFDWLIGMFSYQGVSDQAAANYIATHGNVTYSAVTTALASSSCNCAKLAGYSDYRHCHYAKSRRRCAEPDLISSCPVPTHDLRKGDLNQLAYSLYFFLRDVCDSDLVAFIDRALTTADRPGHPDRVAMMREALFSPLKEIYGVSNRAAGSSQYVTRRSASTSPPLCTRLSNSSASEDVGLPLSRAVAPTKRSARRRIAVPRPSARFSICRRLCSSRAMLWGCF